MNFTPRHVKAALFAAGALAAGHFLHTTHVLGATGSIITTIVMTILGVFLPAITTWGTMELSKLSAIVDGLPDWEKRIVVAIEGAIMFGIAKALGLPNLPDLITGVDSNTLQLIISTAVAYLIHALSGGGSAPAPAARRAA